MKSFGSGMLANLYFYIDYEEFSRPAPELGYFHAQWRRENPTEGWGDPGMSKEE